VEFDASKETPLVIAAGDGVDDTDKSILLLLEAKDAGECERSSLSRTASSASLAKSKRFDARVDLRFADDSISERTIPIQRRRDWTYHWNYSLALSHDWRLNALLVGFEELVSGENRSDRRFAPQVLMVHVCVDRWDGKCGEVEVVVDRHWSKYGFGCYSTQSPALTRSRSYQDWKWRQVTCEKTIYK
jgi:hypothetical protein